MAITIPYVGQRLRKRHSDNNQLRYWYQPSYSYMRVQTAHGPLIENYLATTLRVMTWARQAHSQILAIRVDLRFPEGILATDPHANNSRVSQFLNNLRWELELVCTRPHDMRYVWCREQKVSLLPHYHLLLLFNGNALRSLGDLRAQPNGDMSDCYDEDNLYHRLVRSWEGAIGGAPIDMKGLVNIPRRSQGGGHAVFHFHRDDQNTFQEVFYAASYLCKAYSKPIGQGIHCLEGSRH